MLSWVNTSDGGLRSSEDRMQEGSSDPRHPLLPPPPTSYSPSSPSPPPRLIMPLLTLLISPSPQRQKKVGSVVALLPGKFLRVRKVFAR